MTKLANESRIKYENYNSANYENMSVSDYLVAFSGNTKNYCVGLIDMIGSTKIASKMSPKQIGPYCQFFLNSMSKILSRFGGGL